MQQASNQQEHALKAILLLVLGMSFIPLNDALIKIMSQRLPLAEIVTIRAVISLAILIVFTNGSRAILALNSRTILLFILRGMCLVAAMYFYFLALSSLSISTVVSIFFQSTRNNLEYRVTYCRTKRQKHFQFKKACTWSHT